MRLVGVDGCKGGWLAISYDIGAGTLEPSLHPSFPELLAAFPDADHIAVGIPIGLAEGEPRQCDRDGRRVLGPTVTASSLHPIPGSSPRGPRRRPRRAPVP